MRRLPIIRLAAGGAVALALGAAGPGPFPGAPRCQLFPSGNVWNQRIDRLPAARDSDRLIAAIGLDEPLHPDFSSIRGGAYGIPFTVVSKATPRSRVTFAYADESDRVAYPIPRGVQIERGGDRHALLLDRDACRLYELYGLHRSDLRSNRLRPDGWTSADAAGLPILPGLVRADEVAAGVIRHALRFTAPRTRDRHVYPARHDAGSDDPGLPPMGLRVRLKASVDVSGYPRQARVVLQALKTYGMLLADNGSPWYVSGAPSPAFDDDALHALQRIRGSDLEVVDTARLPRRRGARPAAHPRGAAAAPGSPSNGVSSATGRSTRTGAKCRKAIVTQITTNPRPCDQDRP
jgi:hypothetical protein